MTNLALERALGGLGVGFARAKVGDRYVLELMQERGWDLGGENSGHIICLDKHTTGDAHRLGAAGAARRCAGTGRRLAELGGRPAALSAEADQRARRAGLRLAARRRDRPGARRGRSSGSGAAAGCCCGRPAPSRCCA